MRRQQGGPGPSGPISSPTSQVSSAISLQGHGRPADLTVPDPLQPASDRLLDLDAGRAELIGPKFLQVRHLTGSEEDLSLSELEHVGFLAGAQTEV